MEPVLFGGLPHVLPEEGQHEKHCHGIADGNIGIGVDTGVGDVLAPDKGRSPEQGGHQQQRFHKKGTLIQRFFQLISLLFRIS